MKIFYLRRPMNKIKPLFLLIFVCCFNFFAKAQKPDITPPMKIPMYLSGNFGEIRSNHFHTGLDIKTQGRQGVPIYAIEDGYVARIKVSPWGYGNALYIVHPNGYTSVYAHLKNFNPTIAEYTLEQQYQLKQFAVELYPNVTLLPVKKGEIIAYSGNSGSSGGPHLHFELRKTKSEHPVNPLLFKLPIKDDVKPSIYGIMIYAMNNNSHVNKKTKSNYAMGGTHGNYTLKNNPTPLVHGEISFSVHTIDRLTGVNNKCGIYTLSVYVDDVLYHQQKMEELDFATNRYMNAHIDYEVYKKNRKHYHKCFVEPNNPLDIYPTSLNKGVLRFDDDSLHQVKIEVTDVYGNISVLNFELQSSSETYAKPSLNGDKLIPVSWAKEFTHQTGDWSISMPAKTLYRDEQLPINVSEGTNSTQSTIIQIADRYTAVQKRYTLTYRPSGKLENADKVYLARLNDAGNKEAAYSNQSNVDGIYTFTPKELGSFALMVDSLKPYFKTFNYSKNKAFADGNTIRFSVRDKQSGIGSYNMTIDGKWALLEYDPKRNLMYYAVDEARIGKGPHEFTVTIKDDVGNTTEFSGNFVCQ